MAMNFVAVLDVHPLCDEALVFSALIDAVKFVDMTGDTKCRKWGGLGQLGVTGYSTRLIDRAHTGSY